VVKQRTGDWVAFRLRQSVSRTSPACARWTSASRAATMGWMEGEVTHQLERDEGSKVYTELIKRKKLVLIEVEQDNCE